MIIRTITPPPGSAITVATDGVAPVIAIPQPSGGVMRWFAGLFLLFWLGRWAVGWRSAFAQVMAGDAPLFLVLWLAGWAIGGCFVVFLLFRILRPWVAETLTLGADGVAYDSGVPPFRMNRYSLSRSDFWRDAFQKRTRVTISRQDLRSLRLRETDGGNRLTADVASRRIDLASAASEVEREWLHHVLSERYGLAAV